MLNFILILETILCLVLSIAIWVLLFNISKIKNALLVADLQIVHLRKQIPEIQLALRQISVGHFVQELFFSPASFLIFFEIFALARKKALTRQVLIQLLLKR